MERSDQCVLDEDRANWRATDQSWWWDKMLGHGAGWRSARLRSACQRDRWIVAPGTLKYSSASDNLLILTQAASYLRSRKDWAGTVSSNSSALLFCDLRFFCQEEFKQTHFKAVRRYHFA